MASTQMDSEFLCPVSPDSDDWLLVADNDVDTQHHLSNQILEAELDAEETGDSPEKGDGGHEPRESVFARVERFESTHGDRSMKDDPFWIQSFFDIMEAVSVAWDDAQPDEWKAKMKRQFQTDINLLSGCTGMCAEGWVCKAGCLKCLQLLLGGQLETRS